MNDMELRQNVLAELDYEPSVNATHIGVIVDGGVVTLTGRVASYAEKLAAEAATRRVRGVRAIAQEIEVRDQAEKQTADDEIAKRALDILDWDATLPDGAVQLRVQHGWITLTGDVDWQYQRKAAEEDVRKLTGVKGVINQIALKPSIDVPDVKHRIESALRRRADVEEQALRITAQDGRVILEGTVRNLDERQAVASAAWSAPGVKAVEDRLIIA